MKNKSVRRLTILALIAAVYAVLTMSLGFMSYGSIQFRVAEALCVLPFLFPWTGWGLVAGCLLANLLSAYGVLDVVFGTLATLLACLATAALGRRDRDSLARAVLACLMPVAFNAVIVGALIAYFETDEFLRGAFWPAFGLNALTVGFGELVVLLLLGLPLLRWLPRSKFMSKLQENIEESD